MNEETICDYSDYDYKSEFWTNKNREYEHRLEIHVVRNLLKKYVKHKQVILDAGCGFGRMSESYNDLFEKFILVDYAENLLKQAQNTLKSIDNVEYYQQSLYELNINKMTNVIISIRTLHHLNNIELLFEQFYNTLDKDGILILDIPNHYHIKNKLRHPFKKKIPISKISNAYYNYDPAYVIEKLTESRFNVICKKQLGLFRVGIIKRIIPSKLLVLFEVFVNQFISTINIGPSVYVVAKKG